jgi:hypothetical protein
MTSNNYAIWVYFKYAKWHTLCTLGYVIFCCFMDWPLLHPYFPLTNLVPSFLNESNFSTSLPLVVVPPPTSTMGFGEQSCYSIFLFISFTMFPPSYPFTLTSKLIASTQLACFVCKVVFCSFEACPSIMFGSKGIVC